MSVSFPPFVVMVADAPAAPAPIASLALGVSVMLFVAAVFVASMKVTVRPVISGTPISEVEPPRTLGRLIVAAPAEVSTNTISACRSNV